MTQIGLIGGEPVVHRPRLRYRKRRKAHFREQPVVQGKQRLPAGPVNDTELRLDQAAFSDRWRKAG
jgi:hypothetical protein